MLIDQIARDVFKIPYNSQDENAKSYKTGIYYLRQNESCVYLGIFNDQYFTLYEYSKIDGELTKIELLPEQGQGKVFLEKLSSTFEGILKDYPQYNRDSSSPSFSR